MNNQQLEFEYGWIDTAPESVSERIKSEGADNISTHDLAHLLFSDHASEAIEALQMMVSGNGDIRSVPTSDVRTAASLELLRRIISNRVCHGPEDAYRLVQHFAFENPYQEVFGIITLNGAHEVIRTHLISKGLLNRTLIHPRECFVPAITDHAAAGLIFHTHPSGNTEPSSDDLDVTLRLRRAGQLLGIEILDHIIVSQNGYRSLAESGELI